MNTRLILGLSTGSHDCSYAIFTIDGQILLHNELERDLRIKEASGDPLLYFLYDSRSLVNPQDISICSFVSCPKTLPTAKLLSKLIAHLIHQAKTIEQAASELIHQVLQNSFIKPSEADLELLSKRAKFLLSAMPQVLIKGHHHSHLAEAYFTYGDFSSNPKYILAIDGGGWDPINTLGLTEVHTSFAEYSTSCMQAPEYESCLSLGLLYSEVTLLLGFSISPPVGSQQGSVMGLAAYGDCQKYYSDFADDILWMNTSKANPLASSVTSNVQDLITNLRGIISSSTDRFKVKADIAASLQEAFLLKLGQLIRNLIASHPRIRRGSALLFSGGCSLNCAAIGKLLYDKRFDDIRSVFSSFYVSPVPYDAGLAIGAAVLSLDNKILPASFTSFSPFLGRTYTGLEIMGAVKSSKLAHHDLDLDLVCHKLLEGQIGSIFRGRSESGRRALCNRSIIADPRNPIIRDIMNQKVKKRPEFRPFAPVIPLEDVARFFEVSAESSYMSLALPFLAEITGLVPSVIHKDGTGRLQTVSSEDNPWLYQFLKIWEHFSGVPILINTSFNDNEPIVESPDMAIHCFQRTDIDFLMFPDVNLLLTKD